MTQYSKLNQITHTYVCRLTGNDSAASVRIHCHLLDIDPRADNAPKPHVDQSHVYDTVPGTRARGDTSFCDDLVIFISSSFVSRKRMLGPVCRDVTD